MEKVRYNYRLRPGKEAERWLLFEGHNCRYIWNRLVEGVKKGVWYSEKDLTQWRKELAWLRDGSSVPQQQVVRDFKKARGKRKFKNAHKYLTSLNYVGAVFRVEDGRLRLPHGVSIPVVWSRELPFDILPMAKARGFQLAN